MPRLISALRNHLHFIVIVGILVAAMTWPTVKYVFDTNVFWLPIDSGDIFIKIWDAWYAPRILADPANYLFTDLLFYPEGLSLAYHIFTIPQIILQRTLQLFLPVSNAYNAAYLFIIASSAAAAYVYLLYLIKDRWVSLFGAVVFGFSGYTVGRSQPDLVFLTFLPLTLYFFHRAILEKRWRYLFIAAALVTCTAYNGIYLLVCLLMTLAAYICYFARERWQDRGFWLRILVFCSLVGAVALVRVAPLQANAQAFEDVLDKGRGLEKETDLLQYFVNYANPFWNRAITNRVTTRFLSLTVPGRWNRTYLGYVPLLLIGWGLWRGHYRRRMLPWLMLIAPFLLLRLGSALTINGWQTSILLPKHYLNEIFPELFRAFYSPDHFQIGALFPLAVLSCYGLMTALKTIPARRASAFALLCIALLAVEYYRSPERPRIVTDEETAFLDWLEVEEGEKRLINLPMNRGNSKQYLLYQTLSGYPQVEGLATRTPPAAYAYINDSLLLAAWNEQTSIQCSPENREAYLSALNRLLDDGFSHIVLHQTQLAEASEIPDSFLNAPPSYEDKFAVIYRLEDLRGGCP